MMWRKPIYSVLLLLLCLPLLAGSLADGSLPDPATMSDQEILQESQEISNRQQKKQELSQKNLPLALTLLQSQPTLETSQITLGDAEQLIGAVIEEDGKHPGDPDRADELLSELLKRHGAGSKKPKDPE
jgi:hypothetical protein